MRHTDFQPLSGRHREALILLKNGAGTVHFLIERFTFLGFDFQNWMLIAIGLMAAFIFFVWKTRNRI
jgi:hypothetical protein